ncbi:hypothetical protein ACFL1V_03110 [Pseudomonadota bacterium]
MNKNLALVAVFSVILATNVEAQTNMVLRDGDGDRIGTLLGFETALSSSLASVYTPDGYLIMFDTLTGLVYPREPVYFATADCLGQAYLRVNSGPDDEWAKRGGGLFLDTDYKGVVKIDWNPTVVLDSDIFSGGECWQRSSCDGAPTSCSQGEYVPVSVIDRSQYGMKSINVSGHAGFLPPISFQVQTTGDQIFCDSFECKQQ